MATIRTAIELQDNFSAPARAVEQSMNGLASAAYEVQGAMAQSVNTSGLETACNEANRVTSAVNEMRAAIESANQAVINPDSTRMTQPSQNFVPEDSPREIMPNAPPQIAEITQRLHEVMQMQQAIKEVADHMYVLPENASEEIQEVAGQISRTQRSLEYLSDNPFDLNTSFASLQLDAINESLENAIAKQQELNSYMGDFPARLVNTEPVPEYSSPDVVRTNQIQTEIQPRAPDPLTVPVTPVVREPEINTPEPITVPVIPQVNEQPEINVPEEITVPVIPVVENQPEIEVPYELTVPVTPQVTEQPNIEVPDIQVPQLDVSEIERYTDLIDTAGVALQQIASAQEEINNRSATVEILPDDARTKISEINAQIQRMQAALNYIQENPFDLDAEATALQVKELENSILQALQAQRELNEQFRSMPENIPTTTAPPAGTPPVEIPPVEVPIKWQSDLDVFTSTGIERFQAEVQSANDQLNALNQAQRNIEQTASGMSVLPDGATQDIASLNQRLEWVTQRIQQIQNNPLNIGTDQANAGLEQVRSHLDAAIRAQNNLNTALQNMDASAANSAYLQLSQTIGNTERFIRDNTNAQGQFNQEIQEGISQADKLMGAIEGAVTAYVGINSIGKALDMSDQLTATTSRLNMMNDGVQSTEELVNMVYAAAQDARGSFDGMADVVARFGNNAKDAFGSSEEVVAFANLIQKQMTIAGATTQEAANAELQLSQALGSGVLRGDELNSIFEQAPNLIQNIADYLDVPIGKIREMAADGELSAGVVKMAIFDAADEINAKFESMPMTWGQIWQSMQNTAVIAFRPVLQRLNEIANSEAFQAFVNNAIETMATLANVTLEIFSLVGNMGGFIADNWSVISPIVYGVIGALTVYAAYLAIVKGMEIASAAAAVIHAAAMSAKIGITALLTGSTMAATAAQMGYNGALYACPIVWAIMGIIALIAIILAVCNAIAKMTGIANSGFGVMVGGINVVIQFFRNLGLTVANIALGIGNAIAALTSNMMAAFHNAISNVQSWFYNLLSTACTVISQIAAALNQLPFVEFDYSGITAAAGDYAAKAKEAAGNKEEYQSISDAFNAGFNTFDTFQSGWASDAFNAGAALGDGIADKVANFKLSDILGKTDIPNVDDYTAGFSDAIANAQMPQNLGDTAKNTGKTADTLKSTEEDLKYLRDIAEQEAINRFTTAEIKIEQTNHNTISSDMDLDGIVDGLNQSLDEAIEIAAEGGHL